MNTATYISSPNFDLFTSKIQFFDIFVAQGLFHLVYHISIRSVVSGPFATSIVDYVVIACSLESIRQGLVQGYKAPNGVG